MMERLNERIGKYLLLFMSAYNPSLSEAENNDRFERLQQYATWAKFGRDSITGKYEVTLEDGNQERITENSLCIYAYDLHKDDLEEFALKVGKNFQQETVLFVNRDGSASYMITKEQNALGLPAGTIVPMGLWDATTLSTYYGVTGRRNFQLQSVMEGRSIPTGFAITWMKENFMNSIRRKEDWEKQYLEERERMRNMPPQEISEEEDEKYREWAERVEKKIARGDAEWALMRKFRRGTLKELRRENREIYKFDITGGLGTFYGKE